MTRTRKNKILRIIIEGPDCSGKSTLVERVKNTLRWDSKSLRHKEGLQYFRYLQEYGQTETVFDRGHFSEEVYSKLWRGGSPFSNKQKTVLDQITAINSLVIFAIPPLKLMKERYLARNFEQQINFEELEKVRNLFLHEYHEVPSLLYQSLNFEELDSLIAKVKKEVL